ncbi:fimbrial protein [Serratia oryzae]|uniref:fimbrial protein n=1 Tax=Serratia oryzae TaxID=2034155 RepID=UPI0012E2162B|nr:fimbrial protein [Serratia oryzae]
MKAFWTTLILLMGCAVPSAQAADVTFNISGKITPSSCDVTLGSGQTVPLGTYSTNVLDRVGKITDLKPFEITLENCPQNYNDVQIKFSGSTASPNTQLLALQPDGATNVGIAIYDNDKTTLIPLDNWSAGKSVSTAQSTTLTFYAAYMSMGQVTQGQANAEATFTLSYN